MLIAVLLLACGQEPLSDTPVRATLDDGQVLMGAVQTETLQLITGMGTVDVPLVDIGEVQPVEGGALGGSGNHVSVWLRNGSELRGEWAAPALRMGLQIANESVAVDLPTESLERFQLQGGEMMPVGEVYRIRTIYGDDFVVDPDETWVELDNDLGTFGPALSEIASLEPVMLAGEGSDTAELWRMSLDTGTVLLGALQGTADDGASLELALPLGPEQLTIPIADIAGIERQNWVGYDSYAPSMSKMDADDDTAMGEQAAEAAGGWFDNSRQSSFKKRH